MEYSRDHFSRETKLVGDHLSMGTELVGDRLSIGTNCGEPNVWGPYAFGTKCVTALKMTGRKKVFENKNIYVKRNVLYFTFQIH